MSWKIATLFDDKRHNWSLGATSDRRVIANPNNNHDIYFSAYIKWRWVESLYNIQSRICTPTFVPGIQPAGISLIEKI